MRFVIAVKKIQVVVWLKEIKNVGEDTSIDVSYIFYNAMSQLTNLFVLYVDKSFFMFAIKLKL